MIRGAVFVIAALFCSPVSLADDLTPGQELVVACHRLDLDSVVSLLRDGADIHSMFGSGDAKEYFQDPWSGGSPLGAADWTPLQALANSPTLPPPSRPYENTPAFMRWAKHAKYDVPASVIAARDDRRLDILRILLSHNCSIDVSDHQGATPLYDAVQSRHVAMVAVLLEFDADVNTRTGIYIDGPGNTTPLHAARWSPVLTEMLIEHGAGESALDTDGRTAEDYRQGEWDRSTEPVSDASDPFAFP